MWRRGSAGRWRTLKGLLMMVAAHCLYIIAAKRTAKGFLYHTVCHRYAASLVVERRSDSDGSGEFISVARPPVSEFIMTVDTSPQASSFRSEICRPPYAVLG